MARDRSIKLIIQAQVDGAKRALKETADAAKGVGDETEKASKRADTAAGRLVHSARDNAQAWGTVGTTVTAAGVAMTAGFGTAVARAASFEKEMSGVRAVTNASASEMDRLSEAALEMGAQTAFSASEAAVAQGELARAGVSTADILGGALRGSMDLAAAGGLDLADAAIISAQAMNLFGLAGEDVSHIADVLASGANKSAADVSDLGQALSQAGTVASQTGLSLEETVGALSMFADAGIRGSDAGTSLKSMLQRLTPQSKQARDTMEELGFSAFDAQGNFIGLEALAGELQSSFGGLDTESRQAALGVAFGSDAIRAASVLMSGGAEAAAEYTDAMNDQGAAARMASTMMDNLAGDWEEFGGAVETALIQGGTASNDFLRLAVQGATDLVNVYNGLPAGVQSGVTAIAGVAGVAAIGAGALMMLVPRAVETYDAFKDIAAISPRAASGIGKVGRAAGIAAVAITAITAAGSALEPIWAGMAEGPNEAGESLLAFATLGGDAETVTRNMRLGFSDLDDTISRRFRSGAIPALGEFGAEVALLGGILGPTRKDEAVNFFNELDAAVANLAQAGHAEVAAEMFEMVADRAAASGVSAAQFADAMPQATAALDAIGPAAQEAISGMEELPPVLTEQEAAAQEATEALAEYQAELAGISASFVDSSGAYAVATEAAQAWAQGQADATESTKDSWDDFIGDFTGTTEEYLAELERMAQAQTDWETNLFELIGRGVPAEFVDHLAQMGPDAAEEVALVADMTDEELARWVELMQQRGGEGVTSFAEGITSTDVSAVLVAAGEKLGGDALEALAAKLSSGEMTLQEAIDQYDLDVELGANTDPLLTESDAALAEVAGKTATPKVDADTAPATEKSSQWEYDANAMRPVPKVDADTGPATGKIIGWEYDANSMRPVPIVDANAGTAHAVAEAWRQRTSLMRPTPVIDAADWRARSVARGVVSWINSLTATIGITTRMAGGLNMGGANPLMHSARATGGIERRPMMMGPGYGPTNVILAGEPETRGEAFISNHPNYRRENIEYLNTAASWFGKTIVDSYAGGGVRQRPVMQPATAAPSIDYDRLAAAMSQVHFEAKVGEDAVFRAGRQGSQKYGDRATWGQGSQDQLWRRS